MLIDKHTHYSGALSLDFIWQVFLARPQIWKKETKRNVWKNACAARQIKLQPEDFLRCSKNAHNKAKISFGKLIRLKKGRSVSFSSFLASYYLIDTITKSDDSEENIKLLKNGSYDICKHYAKEGINGFEIRIGPCTTIEKTRQRIQATIDGFQRYSSNNANSPSAKIVLTLIRNKTGDIRNVPDILYLRKLLKLISSPKFQGKIVGIDFSGAEPIEIDKTLLFIRRIRSFNQRSATHKLFITVHAGEIFINRSQVKILQNISLLLQSGINRIGHGTLLWCPNRYIKKAKNFYLNIFRNHILSKIADKQIEIEICPTSNLCLSPLNHYKDIPVKELKKRGIKLSINTDNKGIFQTSLRKELNLMNHHGL